MLHHVKIQYYSKVDPKNLAHYAYIPVHKGEKVSEAIFSWKCEHPESRSIYLVERANGIKVREAI